MMDNKDNADDDGNDETKINSTIKQ